MIKLSILLVRKLMKVMLNRCHVHASAWLCFAGKAYDTCSNKAETTTVLLTANPPVKVNNFSGSIRASLLPFTVFHSGLQLTGYINVVFHDSACCLSEHMARDTASL